MVQPAVQVGRAAGTVAVETLVEKGAVAGTGAEKEAAAMEVEE